MAIDQFSFSKTWRDAEAFPTYQDNEAQVREDLQVLHDELAAYVNGSVVPAVNAAERTAQDTAEAVSALTTTVDETVLGQIPDGSLTAAKLSDGAAAGWEDVTDQIKLETADESDGTAEIAFASYRYSRTLGMMFLTMKLYLTCKAGGDIYIQQTGFPHAAGIPEFYPVSMLGQVSGFLRSYGSGGRHVMLHINVHEAMDHKVTYVSGWYYPEKPEVR